MQFRLFGISFLLLAGACSQRAPWRAVPGPAVAPSRGGSANGSHPERGSVPLSAVAGIGGSDPAALPGSLLFPVSGLDGSRLEDSFDAPRENGRRHNAIDILAPRGTPVLSVQDGHVLRLATSATGGITVYAADLEDHFVFYYAHLDRYHPGVYAGRPLMRGDTLGYVGTTGNAPKDTPHLHFQVMRMPADRRFWNGEPINPYPLLSGAVTAAAR